MSQSQINILMLMEQNYLMRNFIRINLHHYIARCCIEVHPSVLIGSFLVGICHTDRFHGNGHKPCIFLFSKTNSNLQLDAVLSNKLFTGLGDVEVRTGHSEKTAVQIIKSPNYGIHIMPQPAISSPSRHKRAVCFASVLLPFL